MFDFCFIVVYSIFMLISVFIKRLTKNPKILNIINDIEYLFTGITVCQGLLMLK